MSQSPLARSTRRSLPAFSHAPSRLSRATSSRDLLAEDDDETDEKPDIVSSSRSRSPNKPLTPKTNHHLVTPSRDQRRLSNHAGGSPYTPKITYSPYATSTPPQGLSRSSSIPFDMVASAKAARRAEEERNNTPVPLSDTAFRKKRYVRRKPIWSRIVSFPQSVIDKAVFHVPTSIQEVLPDEHLANPISIGIHALHYLLVAPLFSASSEDSSILRRSKEPSGVSGRWEKWENGGRDVGHGMIGGWTKFVFLVLFLGLAMANAAYLFTRFRTYDMQLRSAEEPVKSPHASPVPAPKRKEEEDVFQTHPSSHKTNETPGHKALRLSGHALVALTKFIFYAVLSAFGKPHKNSGAAYGFGANEEKIQSLRVWDPQEFCLAFFCAYPPTAPLLTHLLTPLHPIYTPLLHLSTAFLLSHLARSYNQLVKDRMVLSAEVMREYDQRFVYKRVFANRVDKGVGTNEAEHIW